MEMPAWTGYSPGRAFTALPSTTRLDGFSELPTSAGDLLRQQIADGGARLRQQVIDDGERMRQQVIAEVRGESRPRAWWHARSDVGTPRFRPQNASGELQKLSSASCAITTPTSTAAIAASFTRETDHAIDGRLDANGVCAALQVSRNAHDLPGYHIERVRLHMRKFDTGMFDGRLSFAEVKSLAMYLERKGSNEEVDELCWICSQLRQDLESARREVDTLRREAATTRGTTQSYESPAITEAQASAGCAQSVTLCDPASVDTMHCLTNVAHVRSHSASSIQQWLGEIESSFEDFSVAFTDLGIVNITDLTNFGSKHSGSIASGLATCGAKPVQVSKIQAAIAKALGIDVETGNATLHSEILPSPSLAASAATRNPSTGSVSDCAAARPHRDVLPDAALRPDLPSHDEATLKRSPNVTSPSTAEASKAVAQAAAAAAALQAAVNEQTLAVQSVLAASEVPPVKAIAEP